MFSLGGNSFFSILLHIPSKTVYYGLSINVWEFKNMEIILQITAIKSLYSIKDICYKFIYNQRKWAHVGESIFSRQWAVNRRVKLVNRHGTLLWKFIFEGNKAFLCVILLQFYKSTRYYYHHFIAAEMEAHMIMVVRSFFSSVLRFINVARQDSRIKDIS